MFLRHPKEWNEKPLKYSCKLFGRIGFRGYTADDLVAEGEGAITISPSNMNGIDLDFSHCSYLSWSKYEESPEIMVRVGDVLLVKTASVGKCSYVGSMPMECTVNPQILVLKEHKDCPKYIAYIFQTALGQAYIDVTKGGTTISTISQEKIGNYVFPFPSVNEQQKIANYLDKVCSEVDEMVALQETMIEELKAYKQSVITEAVTKGLNPSVPMHDSGIDWIGEIPEHWSTTKIKKIARTNSGSTPRNISDGENSNIIWIRTTDINDDVVYDSSLHLTSEEYSSASCPMLDEGTCVVAMYGGGGTIGKSGMLGVKATINQALCSMEVGDSFTGEYLFCILRSVRYYWMKYAVGTRKDPNINQEIVRNMIIPFPPIDEQRAIATYLDTKCSEIDSLIALKQAKIEELKEYKKSVIYEYVTGKKEVV